MSSSLERLSQDLSYFLRRSHRNLELTFTIVAALSIGIGVNTAVFSMIDAVLLQPLPYPNSESIVQIMLDSPQGSGNVASVPEFILLRGQEKVFSSVAAYDFGGAGVNVLDKNHQEQVTGMHVSADYFNVFDAPVITGRTFTRDDDRAGAPQVVVVSYRVWRNVLGEDSKVVGRTLNLEGATYVIVGVLGKRFRSIPPADVWFPLQANPNSSDQAHYLRIAARLKAGVNITMAKAALRIAAEQYKRKYPGTMGPLDSFTAESLQRVVVGNVQRALMVLFVAVSFVLLIACADVANLLMAQASVRNRELSIRAALGATRWRIVSQLLTESLGFSLIGAALGLYVGYLAIRILMPVYRGNMPLMSEGRPNVILDWRVLLFTLIVALASALLFGLLPAFKGSKADLNLALKESSSPSSTGRAQVQTRSLLVITEIALGFVLLVGAGLLLRTFEALNALNPGFDARNVLAIDMSINGTPFDSADRVNQLLNAAEKHVDSIPGVVATATTCSLPLEPSFTLPFSIYGDRSLSYGKYDGVASWRSISSRYFMVFEIPLLRGRVLSSNDTYETQPVVVINEAMSKRYWPNGGAVGQEISIAEGLGPEFQDPPRTVVGIVGDVREIGLRRNPEPTMYVPVSQVRPGLMTLENRITPLVWVVKTDVPPLSASLAIQEQLRKASSGLPTGHVRSMEQVVEQATAQIKFETTLLLVFGCIALLLAAIGVYGLMAYSVERRTQEIGIRMAFGATPRRIRFMIFLDGVRLTAIGIALGIASALAFTRLMSALLYGVTPWDALTFSIAVGVLGAVGLVATYIPAARGAAIEPIEALRYE